LAELEAASGELAYVNAGHNPGLLVRRGAAEAIELKASGLPLGLLPGGAYARSLLTLEAGDLLCLYSDGITECAAPDDEEFGMQRLLDCLARMEGEPLGDIVACIDRETQEFAEGQPQLDDQTVVLVRRSV
jgi:sigma-B regulation protein RsbU (phosphoserine phosphatase)